MLAREDLFNKALEERIGKYHRTAEEISRRKEQPMGQLLQRHEVRTPLPIPGGGRTPELSRVPGETDSLGLESACSGQGESMFQGFSVQSDLTLAA